MSNLVFDLNKDNSKLALVVDDDPFNVFVLEELLRGEGYQYESAYTEERALELIKEKVKSVK